VGCEHEMLWTFIRSQAAEEGRGSGASCHLRFQLQGKTCALGPFKSFQPCGAAGRGTATGLEPQAEGGFVRWAAGRHIPGGRGQRSGQPLWSSFSSSAMRG
jgi:hypothetical protein